MKIWQISLNIWIDFQSHFSLCQVFSLSNTRGCLLTTKGTAGFEPTSAVVYIFSVFFSESRNQQRSEWEWRLVHIKVIGSWCGERERRAVWDTCQRSTLDSSALSLQVEDQQGQSCLFLSPQQQPVVLFNEGQSSRQTLNRARVSSPTIRIHHTFSTDTGFLDLIFSSAQPWPLQSSPASGLCSFWIFCFFCGPLWAWAVPRAHLGNATDRRLVEKLRTFWASSCPH